MMLDFYFLPAAVAMMASMIFSTSDASESTSEYVYAPSSRVGLSVDRTVDVPSVYTAMRHGRALAKSMWAVSTALAAPGLQTSKIVQRWGNSSPLLTILACACLEEGGGGVEKRNKSGKEKTVAFIWSVDIWCCDFDTTKPTCRSTELMTPNLCCAHAASMREQTVVNSSDVMCFNKIPADGGDALRPAAAAADPDVAVERSARGKAKEYPV